MKLWKYGQLSSHSYIGKMAQEFRQDVENPKRKQIMKQTHFYVHNVIEEHRNKRSTNRPSHTMQHKPTI